MIYCSNFFYDGEIYELYYEDGKISVKTSPAKIIILSTDRRNTFKAVGKSELLTGATFDISNYLAHIKDEINEHQYIRLTIIDEDGNHAYTRAYFVEEFIDEEQKNEKNH